MIKQIVDDNKSILERNMIKARLEYYPPRLIFLEMDDIGTGIGGPGPEDTFHAPTHS